MTLTVPRDIEALILARVEAGDFASAEEVLRDALRPWLEIERARQANLDRIRARIAEGDADAVDLSPDQVRARLDALAATVVGRVPDAP
jgi:antitoxin ParD1/3/4